VRAICGCAVRVVNRGVVGESGVLTSLYHFNGGPGLQGNAARSAVRYCCNSAPLPSPRFIAAINDGRLPAELGTAAKDVDVQLEDLRAEDFVPPPYVAFGGAGSSLGGGTPAATQPAGAVVRSSGGGGAATSAAAPVDPALPATTVLVKLLDGRKEKIQYVGGGRYCCPGVRSLPPPSSLPVPPSSLQSPPPLFATTASSALLLLLLWPCCCCCCCCRLNLSHTVADLQARVLGLGGHGSRPFVLAAGFPPRVLTEPLATIEAAGLKGAAVVQQAATS
jgi:hypothetical protein